MLTANGNRLLSPTPGQRSSAGGHSPSRAVVRTANAKEDKSKICARCSEFCEGNLRFVCGRRVALCLQCTSSFVKLLDARSDEAARSNAHTTGLRSRSPLSLSRVSNREDTARVSHPLPRIPRATLPTILHARPSVESSQEKEGISRVSLRDPARVLNRPAGRAGGQSPSRTSAQLPEPSRRESPLSSRRLAPPLGGAAFAGERIH